MRRTLPLIASLAFACTAAEEVPPASDGTDVPVASVPGNDTQALADIAWRNAVSQIAETIVRPLLGHGEPVTAVAIGPDGRLVASASESGTIILWDAAAGVRLRELAGHTRSVTGLAFSADGSRLVSTSRDATTRLWSVTGGGEERVLREGVQYASASFSPVSASNPDGSLLALGVTEVSVGVTATLLMNAATGDSLARLVHRGGLGPVSFMRDDQLLIMRLRDGIVAWDSSRRRALWQVTTRRTASSLAVNLNALRVAFTAPTHVMLVDALQGELIDSLATGPGVGPLAFAPIPLARYGGLAVAIDRRVHIWDLVGSRPRERAIISGAMGEVTAMAVDPDADVLVAGSSDGAVWLWDVSEAIQAFDLGLMPWGVWTGPLPPGVGVHCDRRYGPGGVVTGVVMDSLDAVPVASTHVSINGCRVETDDQGRFLIAGVDPGSHSIGAYKPGWRGSGAEIESIVDDTTRVTLRILKKATCNPAEYPNLPRIESEGAEISLRLDDPLQAALDSVAPGFVPYGLETYQSWISSGYTLECYQAPSAVLGDFNGDGVSDLAAVGRSADQQVDLVLISGPDGYLVAREERQNATECEGCSFVYFVRQEPMVLTSPMEADSLVLTTHALHEIFEEKASTLWYWRDGVWLQYVTGD